MEEGNTRLFTRDYILVMIAVMGTSFVNYFFFSTLSLFAEKLTGTVVFAGYLSLAYSATALITRPISGMLSDRRGRVKILIIGSALCVLACILYGFTISLVLLLLIRVLNGIGMSMNTTSAGAAVPDIVPKERLAEGIGIFGLYTTVAQAIGPFIALAIVGSGELNSFKKLFLVSAAFCGVSFIAGCFVRYERRLNRKNLAERAAQASQAEQAALAEPAQAVQTEPTVLVKPAEQAAQMAQAVRIVQPQAEPAQAVQTEPTVLVKPAEQAAQMEQAALAEPVQAVQTVQAQAALAEPVQAEPTVLVVSAQAELAAQTVQPQAALAELSPAPVDIQEQEKPEGKTFLGFELQVLGPALVMMLYFFGISSILSYMTLYGKTRGFQVEYIGWFFFVSAGGLFLARMLFGRVVDKRGGDIVVIPGLVVIAICLALIPSVPSLPLLILLALPYGVASGAVGPSINASMFKRCSPKRRGAVSAAYFAAVDIGITLGAPVMGWIADNINFSWVYWMSGAVVGATFLIYVFFVSDRSYKRRLARRQSVVKAL